MKKEVIYINNGAAINKYFTNKKVVFRIKRNDNYRTSFNVLMEGELPIILAYNVSKTKALELLNIIQIELENIPKDKNLLHVGGNNTFYWDNIEEEEDFDYVREVKLNRG